MKVYFDLWRKGFVKHRGVVHPFRALDQGGGVGLVLNHVTSVVLMNGGRVLGDGDGLVYHLSVPIVLGLKGIVVESRDLTSVRQTSIVYSYFTYIITNILVMSYSCTSWFLICMHIKSPNFFFYCRCLKRLQNCQDKTMATDKTNSNIRNTFVLSYHNLWAVRISSRDNIQNPLIKFIFNCIKLDLWQNKQSVDLYVLISVAVGSQIHNKMVHVLVACCNPRHHEPLFRSNLLGAHYLQQPIAAAC